MAVLAIPPGEAAAPSVRPARRGDALRVFDTLTLALAADPAVRWMFPDPQQHLRAFPAFAKAFGGPAIAHGTALLSEDHAGGHAGAALWLPPDTVPDDEALAALLEESVADREKADAFALFEEMARRHPDRPHWYLPLIGVEPARQGRGHGSALMEHGLRLCDEARVPA